MDIFENDIRIPDTQQCGVGLGNFDGLHRGHMALINTLLHECHVNNLRSVVYTFKNTGTHFEEGIVHPVNHDNGAQGRTP